MNALAIGLMSGTSCDGVSVALSSFDHRKFVLHAYKTYEYPRSLSKQLVRGAQLNGRELSLLNVILGKFFAKKLCLFLKENRVSPRRIAVVGSHGHTIYHGPTDRPPHTLQIGEPSFISQLTGIPVVSDFRSRDLACGGEGAPLIPFFDQYFYGNGRIRAMQNIGGIANVTVVGKNIIPVAFDTGPGNCLIDWVIKTRTHGRAQFDDRGRLASKGKILTVAVEKMSAHPYFSKKPPKSTGRELFNETFLPKEVMRARLEDILATLTFFTAHTIAQAYRRFVPFKIQEVIVSGGGALNQILMNHLRTLLASIPVHSIETFGIPPQAKEPIAFSFFALRALEGKTNRLPISQDNRHNLILGKIVPGNRKTKVEPARL